MPNALPVRRWQARQLQIETANGSPVTSRRSCPQWQAASRTVTRPFLSTDEGSGMYASTRIHEGVSDPQEVARRAREGFVPIISSIEGFVGYYLIDAGGGVMCSTSV